jgi:micrococcal nuclease
MLSLKQPAIESEDIPARWTIGVDRRHVAVYVVLALIAGFTAGFITSRYVSQKQAQPLAAINAPQPAARPAAAEALPQANEFHRVTRIIRADTIEVDGVGIVRMIGIETPDGKSPRDREAVLAEAALNFTDKSLRGQEVRLEFDPANAERGNKDDQGQTLAYVFNRDGTLVNGEMVKLGLAIVRGLEQFKLSSEFRALEREAMQSARGLWASSATSAGSNTPAAQPPAADQTAGLGSTAQNDKSKKLTPLPPSAFGPNLPGLSTGATSNEPMVFVSAGDRMYHKSGCELLDKKKRAVALAQAKSEGYAPCSRCYASTVLKAP